MGIGALQLASKVEEIYAPKSAAWAKTAGESFTKDAILTME